MGGKPLNTEIINQRLKERGIVTAEGATEGLSAFYLRAASVPGAASS